MEFLNLDILSQKPQEKIKAFLNQFFKLYSQKVESVILYGSLVSGNYIEGKSDINLAFVLEDVSLESLTPLLKLFAKSLKQKIALPLLFTSDYIQRSLDSFPLEFLELKENHLLLYGRDIFAQVEINAENLRLQVEQILKGRLLRIRQWYLERGLRGKGLANILEFGTKDVMPALRNLLRLKGILPVPVKKEEIIKKLEEVMNLDLSFLFDIITSKYKGSELKDYLIRFTNFLEKASLIADEI